MFVKVVEEVCFLGLVNTGHHVLRIQEGPDDAHKLHCAAHLGIGVDSHLLDNNVHQEGILEEGDESDIIAPFPAAAQAAATFTHTHILGVAELLQHVFSDHGRGEVDDEK